MVKNIYAHKSRAVRTVGREQDTLKCSAELATFLPPSPPPCPSSRFFSLPSSPILPTHLFSYIRLFARQSPPSLRLSLPDYVGNFDLRYIVVRNKYSRMSPLFPTDEIEIHLPAGHGTQLLSDSE